jgi:hypothetical protein
MSMTYIFVIHDFWKGSIKSLTTNPMDEMMNVGPNRHNHQYSLSPVTRQKQENWPVNLFDKPAGHTKYVVCE